VTVDLHPSAKERIAELISRAIPLIDVEHGKFVKRVSDGTVFLILAIKRCLTGDHCTMPC
jgi:hypothetical protein